MKTTRTSVEFQSTVAPSLADDNIIGKKGAGCGLPSNRHAALIKDEIPAPVRHLYANNK